VIYLKAQPLEPANQTSLLMQLNNQWFTGVLDYSILQNSGFDHSSKTKTHGVIQRWF
jgi:hypothetical protein